jgi:glyoxylase-like metal-dependent hydrolase (beta-lactamase superfamily II)
VLSSGRTSQSINVGQIEVTAIVDAEGSFAAAREAFPTLTDELEARARSRSPELFRGDAWWLPMQVVLIRSEADVVLVDTGLGPAPRDFVPDAEAFLQQELERLGLGPDAVDLVVHTHLHIDHIGWDGTFPRARYVAHEDEWAFFMKPEELARRDHLRRTVFPLQAEGRVDLMSEETEFVPGVRAFPTPGHTPGHVSIRIDSNGESLVVLGDVVVHMFQVFAPETVYVSDGDHELAEGTRRRVLGELADEGVPVIVPHFYGVGRFARDGEGFDWEPLAQKEDAPPVE